MSFNPFHRSGSIALPISNDEAPESTSKGRSRRRLLRYGGLLAFLAFLVTAAILVFTLGARGKHRADSPRSVPIPDEEVELVADDRRLEIYKYQTLADNLGCITMTEDAMIISLPSDSDLTFFMSRGSPTAGFVHFYSQEDYRADDILVNITAEYEDKEELEKIIVCSGSNGSNAKRAGVVLAAFDNPTDITFNISIGIPDKSITRFGDISTDFSNGAFTHIFESFFDIWRPIEFGVVRLKAANAPVYVGGVISHSAFVQTTNAEIQAGFFSVDEIQLRTSNAPLRGTAIGLGQSTGANTNISMITTNGKILAALGLASDYPYTTMNASVHTTNGELFVELPRWMGDESSVSIDSSTTSGPLKVFLDEGYEGTFDMHSPGGHAMLQWDTLGRERSLEVTSGRNGTEKMEGRMFWGEDSGDRTMSSIRARTTVEDVWLYTNYDAVEELEAAVGGLFLFQVQNIYPLANTKDRL